GGWKPILRRQPIIDRCYEIPPPRKFAIEGRKFPAISALPASAVNDEDPYPLAGSARACGRLIEIQPQFPALRLPIDHAGGLNGRHVHALEQITKHKRSRSHRRIVDTV